jgi:hypothetical protein
MAAAPFVLVGAVAVVAGGLVSAVSAMSPSELGSWSAAYLVLVAGVAQIALGIGQAGLAPRTPSRAIVAGQFSLWNLGNLAVLVGTLLDVVPVVDLGGALLVVALALLAAAVRGAPERKLRVLWAFRLLVVVLLVSIPVGLVLARR